MPILASAAGWTALPVTSNDWYSANASAVMSECRSGIVERIQIRGYTPAQIAEFDWVQTVSCYAGTNLTVTTNGVYVYTNTILVSTNIVTTNQFGPFEYNYTDLSGAHVGTGVTFVTSLNLFSLCRWFFDQYGGYAAPLRGGNGASGGMLRKLTPTGSDGNTLGALNRSVETNGNLNAWFATAGGGDYPQALPYWSTGSLLAYTGAGKSIEVTNDVFGLPISGRGFFTQYPGGPPCMLAELSFKTGVWTRLDSVQTYRPMRVLRQTNEVSGPIARYVRADTNLAAAAIVLTCTGEVVRGLSTIDSADEPKGLLAADYHRTNAVLVISTTGTVTDVALPFANIATISCGTTSGVSNNDSVAIYWPAEPAQYMNYSYAQDLGLLTPNVDYTMMKVYLNEVYSNTTALTWWGAGGTWTAIDSTNYWTWSGSSTSSWAAAVSAAQGATPSGATDGSPPVLYTAGTYDGTTWGASAYARRMVPVLGPVTNTISVRGQHYAKATAPSGYTNATYFDTGYEALTEGLFALWDTTAVLTNVHSVTGASLGQITIPTEWCDEPTVGASKAKGWIVPVAPQVALEYDVPGGLVYTNVP
jgi:hypothetical protein